MVHKTRVLAIGNLGQPGCYGTRVLMFGKNGASDSERRFCFGGELQSRSEPAESGAFLSECSLQFGGSEHVDHRFQVVGQRGEADFGLRTRASAE